MAATRSAILLLALLGLSTATTTTTGVSPTAISDEAAAAASKQANGPDLDNSIQQADIVAGARDQERTQWQAQVQVQDSSNELNGRQEFRNKETTSEGGADDKAAAAASFEDNKTTTTLDSSNDLQPAQPANDARGRHHHPNDNHHRRHQLEQQQQQPQQQVGSQTAAAATTTKLLSRRLDLLEFELRKALHDQQKAGQEAAAAAAASAIPIASAASAAAASERQRQQQPAGLEQQALADLAARFELMEKFITIATRKLYETEQRVKQLERCDCRLRCKWTPPLPLPEVLAANTTTTTTTTTATASQQMRPLVKMDGDVWRVKCDVCSCHRGHVKCRHVDCPKLSCGSEATFLPGRCCPVCQKHCAFGGQTVKHGHKLVINSNQNTCKECLCSDGRLKCHRVELQPPPEQPQQLIANYVGGNGSRPRSQRSTPIDLGLDYSPAVSPGKSDDFLHDDNDDNGDDGDDDGDEGPLESGAEIEQPKREKDAASSAGSGRRQLKRRSMKATATATMASESMVCPQIECKLESQFRLENDCCTYCSGFDFCSLDSVRRQHCHPTNSLCFSQPAAVANSTATEQQPRRRQLTLSSMFECRCKPGFAGDGRLCRDIDECAQTSLNQCDSASTYCVNLPGSYQCNCRPGFKRAAAAATTDDDLQPQAAISSGSSSESRRPTSCVDIDECADGKLNRCHEQAKCINLRGSYKCHCRRGYLGNGFECHQWFSGKPGVAAYLHRHSAGSGHLAATFAGRPIQVPLNSLYDPDDDRSDLTRDDSTDLVHLQEEEEDYKYEEEDGRAAEAEEEDEDRRRDGSQSRAATQLGNRELEEPPDLDEPKWEPLKLAAAAAAASKPPFAEPQQQQQQPLFQQLAQAANGSIQQQQPNFKATEFQQDAMVAGREPIAKVFERAPIAAALNTRTMFFQASPKYRQMQENASATLPEARPPSEPNPAPQGAIQRAQAANEAVGDATRTATAATTTTTIDNPVHNQQPSRFVSAPSSAAASSAASTSFFESMKQTNSPPPSVELSTTTAAATDRGPPVAPTGHRRGSIIASAATSPRRGYNFNAASQAQYQRTSYLKAARPSASSSAESSITANAAPSFAISLAAAGCYFSNRRVLFNFVIPAAVTLYALVFYTTAISSRDSL